MQGNTNHQTAGGKTPRGCSPGLPGIGDYHRAKLFGAALVVSLAAGGAVAIPASAAAVQQVSAAEATGAALDPTDEPGGTIIVPRASTSVSATITPADCDAALNGTDKDCRIGVETGPGSEAQAVTQVAPAAGATVASVEEKAAGSTETLATGAADGVSALALPTIYHWPSWTAKICSVSCSVPHPWETRMTSDAYAASDGYAWGDRSRYGLAAEHVRVGATAVGFSISFAGTGFRNDPSCLRLYANTNPKVAALIKGFPVAKTYYMHTHYTECAADGIRHQRRSWYVYGAS